MSDRPDSNHRVNPRYRAYGRARLDIAQRARSRQDWDRMWKRPQFSFPFVWGQHWKQCIEYRVDDFAAEVGFLIDVLGLPVNAFNQEFAMFTGLNREFYFAVTPAGPGIASTPPDAIRIQFMVDDLFATYEELQRRGVAFDSEPQAVAEGSLQWIAAFRTPHGICMELWGMVEAMDEDPALRSEVEPPLDIRLPISQFLEEEGDETDLEDDRLNETDEDSESEPELGDEDIGEPEEDEPDLPSTTSTARQRPGVNTLPPAKPGRLFNNGQEMLDHLKEKGRSGNSTPGNGVRNNGKPAPVLPPAFRPAPKPAQTESKPGEEDIGDIDGEAARAQKEFHYKPIPFYKE